MFGSPYLHGGGYIDKSRGDSEQSNSEGKVTALYPKGDVMSDLKRGVIQRNWNAGLRNPQAKKLTVDNYNSGCRNTWGCVPTIPDQLAPGVPGFSCLGEEAPGVGSMGPEMNKVYVYLNNPFLSDEYEFNPPGYMMGIKSEGPNSVDGWKQVSEKRGFTTTVHERHAASFLAASGSKQVPGCG
jgi:hypothetical protein